MKTRSTYSFGRPSARGRIAGAPEHPSGAFQRNGAPWRESLNSLKKQLLHIFSLFEFMNFELFGMTIFQTILVANIKFGFFLAIHSASELIQMVFVYRLIRGTEQPAKDFKSMRMLQSSSLWGIN